MEVENCEERGFPNVFCLPGGRHMFGILSLLGPTLVV